MRPRPISVVYLATAAALGACHPPGGQSASDAARDDAANDAAATRDAPIGDGSAPASDAVHGPDARPPRDVTFFVVSDTHADPPESYDLRAMARAINAVAEIGRWPTTVNGQATGFVGGPVGSPSGVVFLGDITGWGTAPLEIPTFRRYFIAGTSADSIRFPAYVGLGNHDVDDADRPPALAASYRAMFWSFVDERHRGASAPVPVTAFHDGSHAYSWDTNDVHFVQTHRFAGDTGHGLPSSLGFVTSDLDQRAGATRPVFTFHHYGMDAFGTQDRWWTAAQRAAYREALRHHDVAGIFVGHSHAAFHYTWEGMRVFHVNNAKAENGTGNNDGNGSFAVVRITDNRLDVATCRWLDDQGRYEWVAPFYSGPASSN